MSALERRKFIQSSIALSALPLVGFSGQSQCQNDNSITNRFKLSLNAYSFNAPLRSGQVTLGDVIDFCAAQGFAAADLTAYYFPGYPQVPSDEYLYQLKRKAHKMGIAISGTGVRNDFAEPDKGTRSKDVLLVKNWIEVAAKLGAPVIRIFSGRVVTDKAARDAAAAWMVDDIKTCVEYGKKHGVIVALQNHDDFIKTADETIDLIKKVNDEWFGLVLDTGSFVTNEPYSEIEKVISYAVNWQLKEKIRYNGKNENTDLIKIFRMIKASAYRGYLPIETLSPGDPYLIIPPFL
ncbi:MAG TPA: sugar phosphate isomerase/epimerase family protein, partial [Flavitalea sp.]|nr:sugar phosphate isomerase/epimerase family protein [Flavitalea sp.]